ncbi:universal stress protein [Membranihabitans marinus]|uniref:universal stress protein n=1 Tax=Membranihabitans marinus TaxID=1227546 RepID=UPI001F266F73|nr:universal stress protein [Membranihabitans marinus]
MRTVLIPTNFSAKAHNATQYVVDMFASEAIHYVLLHAYDVPYQPNEIMVSSVLETLKNEVEQNLAKEKSNLEAKVSFNHSIVSTITGIGSVMDVIRYNEEINPDFIVLATSGRREVNMFLIGSNTQQVLKNTDIPLIVVPQGRKYKKFKNIVYGSDLKSLSQECLKPLIRLLDRTDADLTVVHVGELDDIQAKVSEDELKSILGDRMTAFIQYDAPEISQGLEDCVRKVDADLLVVVDRKRTFFKRLFHHSITKTVEKNTLVPLLVLHE